MRKRASMTCSRDAFAIAMEAGWRVSAPLQIFLRASTGVVYTPWVLSFSR